MKVAQLARLLDSLTQGLEGILAAGPTADLKSFRSVMQPFADRSVGEFVAFLSICEEYQRTGVVPGKKSPGSRKPASVKTTADPHQVAQAVGKVRTLLDEISQGTVDGPRIEETLAPLTKLSMPQLKQILAELHIAGNARSKAAAVSQIRQVVKSQAEMYVKTHTSR